MHHGDEATANAQMVEAAAAKGYDSIQILLVTEEPAWASPCAGAVGYGNLNYEIISTRLAGSHACGSANGTSSLVRAGWKGARACVCDNSKSHMNCAGVPY